MPTLSPSPDFDRKRTTDEIESLKSLRLELWVGQRKVITVNEGCQDHNLLQVRNIAPNATTGTRRKGDEVGLHPLALLRIHPTLRLEQVWIGIDPRVVMGAINRHRHTGIARYPVSHNRSTLWRRSAGQS